MSPSMTSILAILLVAATAFSQTCPCEQEEFENCLVATATPFQCSSYVCRGFLCVDAPTEASTTCQIQNATFITADTSFPSEDGTVGCSPQLVSYALPLWQAWPEVIELPRDQLPEGIAADKERDLLYVSSRGNGQIYEIDAATGGGQVVVPGVEGRRTIGLFFDQRTGLLYACAATVGYVFDVSSGATVVEYAFDGGFVNDVIVFGSHAFFTDSRKELLYSIVLDGDFAPPTDPNAFRSHPLTGLNFDPTVNNLNGIEVTPDNSKLLLIHGSFGILYSAPVPAPAAGAVGMELTVVPVTGTELTRGDGLLLEDRTLYVVRNRENLVTEVLMDEAYGSGSFVTQQTNPNFDVPTTVVRLREFLYLPNARFGTSGVDLEFDAVRISM